MWCHIVFFVLGSHGIHLGSSFCPELLGWPRHTVSHRLGGESSRLWAQRPGTASGHSVRAQHPGSLPLLQPGWQRSRAAWLAPSLACFLFFIILLPFGLNDCIWLTYFLTLGISLCFSTGALLAFVAERFLCSYAGLFNIPGHAH